MYEGLKRLVSIHTRRTVISIRLGLNYLFPGNGEKMSTAKTPSAQSRTRTEGRKRENIRLDALTLHEQYKPDISGRTGDLGGKRVSKGDGARERRGI